MRKPSVNIGTTLTKGSRMKNYVVHFVKNYITCFVWLKADCLNEAVDTFNRKYPDTEISYVEIRK